MSFPDHADGCPMFAQRTWADNEFFKCFRSSATRISFFRINSSRRREHWKGCARLFQPMYAGANMGHPFRLPSSPMVRARPVSQPHAAAWFPYPAEKIFFKTIPADAENPLHKLMAWTLLRSNKRLSPNNSFAFLHRHDLIRSHRGQAFHFSILPAHGDFRR